MCYNLCENGTSGRPVVKNGLPPVAKKGDEIMSEFSKKLKRLRLNAGLTQADVAKRTAMSASAVGMYEQGRREPDFGTVQKFCDLYGVTPNYLMQEEGGAPSEIHDVINTMREQMKGSDGLMFNGVPVSEEDTEKIFDAMLLAARLVMNEREKKEQKKCEKESEVQ